LKLAINSLNKPIVAVGYPRYGEGMDVLIGLSFKKGWGGYQR